MQFDLLHFVLFSLALVALAWAYRLSLLAAQARQKAGELADSNLNLAEDLNVQRTKSEQLRLELAQQTGQSTRDKEQFSEIAGQVMQQAQRQFIDLANETFSKHKEGAKGDLEKLVQPIGKNLDEFAKRVSEIERVRAADKSAIQEQVRAIGDSLRINTSETGKLVAALSAPKGGGRWGETTLRNVMEHAGLSSFCDFTEQVSDRVDGKSLRPDVVIRLPGGREIVVDSKVSIDDYLKAIDEPDLTKRTMYLKAHGRTVREHIKTLGGKAYQDAFSERVDFVALFIPGENFYVAALEYEPDLFDFAAAKQVIVVTPSTLLALAKAVAYGWRQEQATENARHAAELGRQLYDRLVTMGAHIENMGKSLNSAVGHYNKMGASLNSRVLSSARKFQDLHIGAPDKEVTDLEAIETRAVLPDRTGELDFDDKDKI